MRLFWSRRANRSPTTETAATTAMSRSPIETAATTVIPRSTNILRFVVSGNPSPTSRSLLLQNAKEDGQQILVQTLGNGSIVGEQAVEFDVKAVMSDSSDLLSDSLEELNQQKDADIACLLNELSRDKTALRHNLELLRSKEKRIAKLEADGQEWTHEKANLILNVRSRDFRLSELSRENLQLKGRVEAMEQFANCTLSDKLEQIKQSLLQEPETFETEEGREEVLEKIQEMELVIKYCTEEHLGGMTAV